MTYKKVLQKLERLKNQGIKDNTNLELYFILQELVKYEPISINELLITHKLTLALLQEKVEKVDHTLAICAENMNYVRTYLSGDMYKDQQKPDKYAEIQIDNLDRALGHIDAINAPLDGRYW